MQFDQQLEFYRTRFGKVQPRLQVDVFRTDLVRLNLDVMSAALQETEAAAMAVGRAPKDARLAILARYERSVALLGQLFPVFFTFESAWRSYVAARLALVYGADDWWHPIRAMSVGGPVVATLGGAPAKPEVVTIVTRILAASPRAQQLVTTYDLIEEAGIGQIGRLIERHWSDMSSPFSSTAALGVPTSGRFQSLFGKVRNARNDAYHHRVVSDRAGVVSAAEQLLDLLDMHLGTRVAAVDAVQLPALNFTVFREPRHG